MSEHKSASGSNFIESKTDKSKQAFLSRHTNQALGIAQFAIDFLSTNGKPDDAVLKRTELFHTDSVVCGLSALALHTNAPTVLRDEALEYTRSSGAAVFGSKKRVAPEKAIVANVAAVREWDSNGTVFGYNPKLGSTHMAGEFGHNDFYPVVIAACEQRGLSGEVANKAMVLVDEIRGRLAEVFSLKTYKIDHVVHGAIASAAVYGALMGATAAQIESAIGMSVAHYIPFRAIRAGEQLSDSKGASAAISTEVAIMSVHRAMRGFVGPQDIFRNPESIFRLNEPTKDGSAPFDLVLTFEGSDFAVMGMHFKLGLYEHQSAGALQGLIDVLAANPHLTESNDAIKSIKIVAYQPAYGIIGDPAKRNPETRQSADHSMVYIVSRMLKKAQELGRPLSKDINEAWEQLILTPLDYSRSAINDPETRKLMALIEFAHGNFTAQFSVFISSSPYLPPNPMLIQILSVGGKEYDEKYPEGIPTSVVITDKDGKVFDSGLVMFPAGHSLNTSADLEKILNNKFRTLGALAVSNVEAMLTKLGDLKSKSVKEIRTLYEGFDIQYAAKKRRASASGKKGSAKKGKLEEEDNNMVDEEF